MTWGFGMYLILSVYIYEKKNSIEVAAFEIQYVHRTRINKQMEIKIHSDDVICRPILSRISSLLFPFFSFHICN